MRQSLKKRTRLGRDFNASLQAIHGAHVVNFSPMAKIFTPGKVQFPTSLISAEIRLPDNDLRWICPTNSNNTFAITLSSLFYIKSVRAQRFIAQLWQQSCQSSGKDDIPFTR